MKIHIKPRTVQEMEAATLRLCLKVRDEFTATLLAADGSAIHDQDDGYVPDFMPGQHHGDYVMLDIDVDTGRIKNWNCDAVKLSKWAAGPGDDE